MPLPADDAPAEVSLLLHGVPAIARTGGAPLPLERKDAAWLALLALEGALPRERIAAWLWPASTPRAAAGSLRQRIFRLRRRLGHDLVRAGDSVQLLPGVRLVPAEGALLAGGDYADCPEFATWLEQAREAQRAARLQALAAAATRHEAAREWPEALAQVQALLALEPLSEHVQRQLMRLHYLRGDRAAAIAAFERFERLLKDELGTRPGAETQALLHTIEAAAPLPAPVRAEVPAALLRPPRLVGRQREQAGLAHAWAAGHVAWLLGEAGMGKTRLLDELAAGPPGALRVAARPGDAGVPFALLARLLRALREGGLLAPPDEGTRRELARVLPELGAGTPPAGEGQRLLLQRAVEQVLAGLGAGALLLDDLHFADAASLELLQGLLPAAPPALRWALAQRPGEGVSAAAALRDALAEAQRLHEVVLAPLDEAAMAALVESLGLPELDGRALAPALVRHTGGNPLFALETLKDLVLRGEGGALPQPASVGALIERRLKTLSAPALALARVAAIAGPDFGIELAEAVLGQGALALADPWTELQAAQVLAGQTFAHDLVFDAVQRSVPQPVAAHLHARVAGWLQQRGAEPARVAAHWHAARRWREAAEAFACAAGAARQAGRLGEAFELQSQAVACWREAGDDDARWACEHDAVELVLQVHGVAEASAQAGRLADEATAPARRASALASRAGILMFGSLWAETLAVADQALALAGPAAPLATRLTAQRARSAALVSHGRADEAQAALQSLQDEVDREGSLLQRLQHRSALTYVLQARGRLRSAAAVLPQCLELATALGDAAEQMTLLANLAACDLATGYAARARATMRAALLLRERVGVPGGASEQVFQVNQRVAAMAVGEFGEALPLLETGSVRWPAGSQFATSSAHHGATLWLLLGQVHRAQAVLADAPPLPPTQGRRVTLEGRIARLRGQPAPALLQAELARRDAVHDARDQASLRLELSRACDRGQALRLVREARRVAHEAEFPGLALHAQLREVDLLVPVDPGRALELAAELAAADPELVPTDALVPERDLVIARAHAAGGDADAARRHLQAAQAWIDRAAATLPPGLRRGWLEVNPVCAAVAQALRDAAAG